MFSILNSPPSRRLFTWARSQPAGSAQTIGFLRQLKHFVSHTSPTCAFQTLKRSTASVFLAPVSFAAAMFKELLFRYLVVPSFQFGHLKLRGRLRRWIPSP